MAKAAVSAIRLWAYPATVIILWLFASALSLSQLATVLPSLAAPPAVQRPLQPRGCDDVC